MTFRYLINHPILFMKLQMPSDKTMLTTKNYVHVQVVQPVTILRHITYLTPRFNLQMFQNLTKNTDIVHDMIKILFCCCLQTLTLPSSTMSLSPIKYVYRIYMWDYTPSRLVVIDYSRIYKSFRHHIGLHKWFDDQFVNPVWYRIHFTWRI